MKKNILMIVVLVIIDQIIKTIIFKTIGQSGNTVTLIPNILALNYVENIGGAFGILMTRIFLIGVNLMIIVTVWKLMVSKKYQFDKNAKFGMALIVAGGLGNVIDRIFRGYVIDYLDITEMFNYPVFNFADICIVIGVIIVMVTILINTVKSQESMK